MRSVFTPVSLGVTVLSTALTGAALVVLGVVSFFQPHPRLSIGTGLMLLVYGGLVLLGAWLAHRRHPLGHGLVIAPALLHLATSISLLGGRDPLQLTVGISLLALSLTTLAAGFWPSTVRALRRDPA